METGKERGRGWGWIKLTNNWPTEFTNDDDGDEVCKSVLTKHG